MKILSRTGLAGKDQREVARERQEGLRTYRWADKPYFSE